MATEAKQASTLGPEWARARGYREAFAENLGWLSGVDEYLGAL
jgi:hypothetical protein